MKKSRLNTDKPKKRSHVSHKKTSQAETVRAIKEAHDKWIGKVSKRFEINRKGK